MAAILIYDEVNGYVKDYKKSANTALYVDRTDVLINPVIPGPLNQCMVDKGSLRLMTAGEQLAYENKYKLDNYVHLRLQSYPPIEDQLEAILKQLNYDRMEGKPMIQEMDNIINAWLKVKQDYPKPQ